MDKRKDQKEAGLYEFDFEDISVDDLDEKNNRKIAASRDDLNSSNGETERKKQELKKSREEKLLRKRARRKGWSMSVGFFTWVKDLAVVLLIVWLVLSLAGFSKVQDSNNEPTLKEGEHLLIIKFSYKLTKPARGEMVAVKNAAIDGAEEQDNGVFFGRVIGLPGDKVYINGNGGIFVNDKPLVTKYCEGTTSYIHNEMSYPFFVPEDSYFILSDNPVSTLDSRYRAVGAVSLENIEGKVFGCFWPREAWRPIH